MTLSFRKDSFCSFYLFVVVVFSVWITPDFVFSGITFPNFIPLLCSFFGFFFLLDCKLSLRVFRVFVGMVLCVFASIILVPSVVALFSERVTGAVQIVFSIFVFFVSSEVYKKSNKSLFISILSFFWFFLVVMSILEFLGLTNDVVNDVRYFIYNKSIYESSMRDIIQYGVVRPITLMREPAHLALLLSVLSMVISLSYRKYGFFLIVISFFVVLYIVRSPLVILMPAAYFSILLFMYEGSRSRKALLFFFILIVAVAFIISGMSLFQSRIVNIMDGVDFSAASRLISPPLVTFNVLMDYPIFGLGPTADSFMYFYVYDVFQNLGFDYQLKVFDEAVISKRVTNYLFLNFIYFGLLGGFFIISMLWVYFRFDLSKTASFSVLTVFFIFGFGIGSYVTPTVWIILFLIFVGVRQYCYSIDECKKVDVLSV